MDFFTVSQVGDFIAGIFRQEEFLHNIRIYGEVSGFKISKNHAYFTLKDEENQIQCSCFNYAKTYTPNDGESVIIKGSPNYYSKGGKLSFVVDYIEPVGKGLLYIQLEELKKKLSDEGLFSDIYKKRIPKFCENIGVVTSKTGAVIRDICTTVRKYNKHINIILKDAKVQGIGAVEEIISGIEELDKLDLDAIIVARGGGSFEDLMPFNNEKLSRAIFNAKTPIISAVGHETDFTICDFVSDYSCATPTASGELVSYNQVEYKSFVADNIIIANKYLLKKLEVKSREFISVTTDLTDSINMKYANAKQKTYNTVISIKAISNKKIVKLMFDYIDINKIINRFGSKTYGNCYINVLKDGKIITDLNKVEIGDNIQISSNKIKLYATVTKKEGKNE